MRRFLCLSLSWLIYASSGFAAGFSDSVAKADLVIYFPSFKAFNITADFVMQRFYGKNTTQMKLQYGLQSKDSFGLDIFDEKDLTAQGIDINAPLAYVHISNDCGYFAVTVSASNKAAAFVKSKLGDQASARFAGKVLIVTEKRNGAMNIKTPLASLQGFKVAAARLNFNWDKPFVWIDSRYVGEASAMLGAALDPNANFGFTALTLDISQKMVKINTYSGMIDPKQAELIRQIKSVSDSGKFDILDFGWGTPAVVGNINLNLAQLYKYYLFIDRQNVLGMRGLSQELQVNYKVNMEQGFIQNTDGRLKLVVSDFDTKNNKYNLYGIFGVKSEPVAKGFIESIKTAVLSAGIKLTSFELFTYPFYHYKSTNYSIFFGLIDNDFFFATDKETLVKLVKNVFENKSGFLATMPVFFSDACKTKKVGYSMVIDVQSYFNNVKADGFQVNQDFFTGIQSVYIYGNPDTVTDEAYGWNTTIEINFYRK